MFMRGEVCIQYGTVLFVESTALVDSSPFNQTFD